MTQVVLFHHVLGLTDGVRAFAQRLRDGGHTVHTPDLYDGVRLETIPEGMAHRVSLGMEELDRRVERAVEALPDDVVWAGISAGVVPAQRLAQTRAGARGALLYEACIPITGEWAFGPWPQGVPVQIHGMDADTFFAGEGDIEAARELVETVGPDLAGLFTYPGDRHLFFDASLPSYEVDAAEVVVARTLEFLGRVG